jgi:hypothetical protein
MSAPRIASLVAVLVLTASVDLFAQQGPPVAPGDRVRVTAPTIDPDMFVGTLVAMGADTCVLEVEGRAEQLALPLASVEKLEVSLGQKTKAGQYAGAYALAGLAAGLGVAAAVCRDEGCVTNAGNMAGYFTVALVAAGAGVGALVGAGIGSAIEVDDWAVVDLQSVRVGLTPLGRRGLAVSVSVAF